MSVALIIVTGDEDVYADRRTSGPGAHKGFGSELR